jgi:pimeloyl-ACP methyl ester carboxylesterase
VPGSRLRVLEGLGHLMHEEQPLLVSREILDFLSECVGAGASVQ